MLEATGATRKSSQLSPVQSPLICDNLFIFRGVKRDLWKRPWCRERFRAGEEGATDNKMVGWHHRLNEHEFEQTPGDSGQGSLVSCSLQGCRVGHDRATEQQRSLEASSQEFCGCLRLVPAAKAVTFARSLLNMPRKGQGREGQESGQGRESHPGHAGLTFPFLLGFLLRSQALPTRTM